ncbi:ABC transporter, ATP-binding protein 2 (cluster 4, leucine/isoleucine/valine/benzoate) [Olavius sp. associated proteobacterium Delta 1]|nr:ABC transporter, ATP-binding protein 2 (cluster 4, leucine/isoleucine/valine/benzoate) [Olavius sp. associated proteobacterium Delta 1]
MAESILELKEVHTFIDQHHILQGVTLDVTAGRPTVLLGRNGAGKSSTLRAIIGLNPVTSGEILFENAPINGRPPYDIARRGIGFVAEDKAVFYNLTVEENMRLSMFEETEQAMSRLETVCELFPDLKRLWRCNAGLLSGGQKQMLAIGRAFVNDHRLLLVDEPSKGLAPIVVEQVGESLLQIKDQTTIILVEQNFHLASMVGTDYFILDDGRVVHQGLMEDLADNQELKQKYLGIG